MSFPGEVIGISGQNAMVVRCVQQSVAAALLPNSTMKPPGSLGVIPVLANAIQLRRRLLQKICGTAAVT